MKLSHIYNQVEYLAIAKIIAYSDVFEYPLLLEEISERSTGYSIDQVKSILDELLARQLVFKFDDFYTLKDDSKLVARRLKGNKEAEKWLPTASKNAKKLFRFPFVRGVMLSGSLSKNYMDQGCDVDYFIVTQHKRVWLAHLLLFIYRKICFRNHPQLLCMNYFVDEKYLEIPFKNYYTAFECVSVKALYGYSSYDQFVKANQWTNEFFPFYPVENKCDKNNESVSFFKKTIEWGLSNRFGDWLDTLILKIQHKRLRKIYPENLFLKDGQNINLLKHSIKIHAGNYFKKITASLEKKLLEFQQKIDAL